MYGNTYCISISNTENSDHAVGISCSKEGTIVGVGKTGYNRLDGQRLPVILQSVPLNGIQVDVAILQ